MVEEEKVVEEEEVEENIIKTSTKLFKKIAQSKHFLMRRSPDNIAPPSKYPINTNMAPPSNYPINTNMAPPSNYPINTNMAPPSK